MIEKFKQLEPEKQKRILDAAFIEFTKKNYKEASTNVIAKNAGIGKGTLFYYFESKQKLFNFLIEYVFDLTFENYLSKVNLEETDFIKRLRDTTKLKWKLYAKHSADLEFLGKIFLHQKEFEWRTDLQKKREIAEINWSNILTKNIDLSKFREDIPAETSLKFIQWTIEGYRIQLEAEFASKNKLEFTDENLQPYYDEFYDYLDTLKKIYYKAEYVE